MRRTGMLLAAAISVGGGGSMAVTAAGSEAHANIPCTAVGSSLAVCHASAVGPDFTDVVLGVLINPNAPTGGSGVLVAAGCFGNGKSSEFGASVDFRQVLSTPSLPVPC